MAAGDRFNRAVLTVTIGYDPDQPGPTEAEFSAAVAEADALAAVEPQAEVLGSKIQAEVTVQFLP